VSVLLTSAYCPPIEYFAAIAAGLTLSPDRVIPSVVYLEACENYQKQSWRNRCTILSATGPLNLSFPIIHRGGSHNSIPVSEVEIDYSVNWVLQHKRAIESSYGTSAFFEYYRDELFSILDARPALLFELNLSLLHFFLLKTGISADIRFTREFSLEVPEDMEDLRFDITPKKANDILRRLQLEKPYFQVFSQKYGFVSGLSVMDLLFNEGPDSISYLKKL